MIEKGMGRTRLGRFAAVTVPATVVTAGLGFAVLQGMVGASLSAADPFQVAGTSLAGSGLELSLRGAQAATSNTDATATDKKSALVTVGSPTITDMCLAANQANTPLGTIGLKIQAAGNTSLGSSIDLSADSVNATQAVLPTTEVGLAQQGLDHQSTVTQGYNAGGFGMEATGAVSLTGLKASAYGLTLAGLTLNNLAIAPQLGAVSC